MSAPPTTKIWDNVRALHYVITFSFCCAFTCSSMIEEGWFSYKNNDYGTLNTIQKSNKAGEFAFACCIIASFSLFISVISLYLRIYKPESPEYVTPLATFSALLGSMILFLGTLSYFVDFWIHFTRWCADCNWSELYPKAGIILGFLGGFLGLVATRLLFVHQSQLGGLQMMPQRYNVLMVVSMMIVPICASVGASSTGEGWFFASDGFYVQADWGNKEYTHEFGDDQWITADLPDAIEDEGEVALILCSIASGAGGMGLLLFLSSLADKRLSSLDKSGFGLTFGASVILLAATIRYQVTFAAADRTETGYYYDDGSPYYSFYLGVLGGIIGIIASLVGFVHRNGVGNEGENTLSENNPILQSEK